MGRLHTRYAPVRRWHCCPLDLHVLSLPLAFILSQDQTLHCKILVFILGLDVCLARTSQQVNELYSSTISGFRLANSNPFKLNYLSLSPLPFFFHFQSDCKVTTLNFTIQIIFNLFSIPDSHSLSPLSFVVSECKGLTLFLHYQIIFNLFFNPNSHSLLPLPFAVSEKFFRGAKVWLYFYTTKLFLLFF